MFSFLHMLYTIKLLELQRERKAVRQQLAKLSGKKAKHESNSDSEVASDDSDVEEYKVHKGFTYYLI